MIHGLVGWFVGPQQEGNLGCDLGLARLKVKRQKDSHSW